MRLGVRLLIAQEPGRGGLLATVHQGRRSQAPRPHQPRDQAAEAGSPGERRFRTDGHGVLLRPGPAAGERGQGPRPRGCFCVRARCLPASARPEGRREGWSCTDPCGRDATPVQDRCVTGDLTPMTRRGDSPAVPPESSGSRWARVGARAGAGAPGKEGWEPPTAPSSRASTSQPGSTAPRTRLQGLPKPPHPRCLLGHRGQSTSRRSSLTLP